MDGPPGLPVPFDACCWETRVLERLEGLEVRLAGRRAVNLSTPCTPAQEQAGHGATTVLPPRESGSCEGLSA